MARLATRNCPALAASRKRKAQLIAATPPESPSMLSSKLKEFVMATIQRMVAAIFRKSLCRASTRTSATMRSRAATVWPRSLTRGRRPARSSQIPRKETSVAPTKMPTVCPMYKRSPKSARASAEAGDCPRVRLARIGLVDHAGVQREPAGERRDADGQDDSRGEDQQVDRHGYFFCSSPTKF